MTHKELRSEYEKVKRYEWSIRTKVHEHLDSLIKKYPVLKENYTITNKTSTFQKLNIINDIENWIKQKHK